MEILKIGSQIEIDQEQYIVLMMCKQKNTYALLKKDPVVNCTSAEIAEHMEAYRQKMMRLGDAFKKAFLPQDLPENATEDNNAEIMYFELLFDQEWMEPWWLGMYNGHMEKIRRALSEESIENESLPLRPVIIYEFK